MVYLKSFEYYEPKTIGETLRILADCGEKGKILAGGVDLIPKIRKGEMKPEYVINIQNVKELDYIEEKDNGEISIGAMASLNSIESSKIIYNKYPILHEAIQKITSTQVKYMGTAIGNICVATPASDVATSLFTLKAKIKIISKNNERIEPIEKFYIDYHKTSLEAGEMVSEVILPSPKLGTKSAFLNLVRTHADISKIIVAIALVISNGICQEARIAIGAAAPTVFRATKAEDLLTGQKISSELINIVAETGAKETRPITDLRSTAEYRKEMAKVLIKRALEKILN